MSQMRCQKCGYILAQLVPLDNRGNFALDEDGPRPTITADPAGPFVECPECGARNRIIYYESPTGILHMRVEGLR